MGWMLVLSEEEYLGVLAWMRGKLDGAFEAF